MPVLRATEICWTRRLAFVTVLSLMVAQGAHVRAQSAVVANQEYLTPEARRKAAIEMDHGNRPFLEESARLIESCEIAPGDVVADIGTGVGYMVPLLVNAVGPTGSVLAQDIYPDFLASVREKIRTNDWRNVTTVLGTPTDPKLPHGEIDVALLVDVYHHLDYPGEVISRVRASLKPGGRLIIVDSYRTRAHPRATPKALRQHVRGDRDDFAEEIVVEGFRLVDAFDHLSHQYVLVFVPEWRSTTTLQLLQQLRTKTESLGIGR